MILEQFLLPDETSLHSINKVSAVSLSCNLLTYSTFFLQQSSYDFSSLTQTGYHRRGALIKHLLLCYTKVCGVLGIKLDVFSVPGSKFRRSLFPSRPDRGSNLLPASSRRLRTSVESAADTTGQTFP